MAKTFHVDVDRGVEQVTVTVVCAEVCTAAYLEHQEEYDGTWEAVDPEHEDWILIGIDFSRPMPGTKIADAVQIAVFEGREISMEDAKYELEKAVKEMADLDAAHAAGYLGGEMFTEGHESTMDWGDDAQWNRIDDLGAVAVASAGDAWLVGDSYFAQNEMLGRGKTPSHGKDLELWKAEDIELLEKRLRERGWERAPEFSIEDVTGGGRDYIEEEVQSDHALDHMVDNLGWPRDTAPSLLIVWDTVYGAQTERTTVTAEVTLEVWVPGPGARSIWDDSAKTTGAARKLKNRLLR